MNNFIDWKKAGAKRVDRVQYLTPEISFHELMRQVEVHSRSLPKLGENPELDRERIYFKHKASLAFAPREIQALRIEASTNRLEVSQRFFGFYAPYGPMPIDFTHDVVHHLSRNSNSGFDDFLDLYLQRLILLRYRAWADLSSVADTNGYEARLSDMTDDECEISNAAIKDVRRRFPSIYLRPQSNIQAFAIALSKYFQVPILIQENQGTRISFENNKPSFGSKLKNMVLGRSVYDRCRSITTVVGTLTYQQAQLWKRNSPRVKALKAILSDFLGARFFAKTKIRYVTSKENRSGFNKSTKLGDSFVLKPNGKNVETFV